MFVAHTIVDNSTPRDELLKHFANPAAIVDITNLDINHVPARFSSSLYSKATEFIVLHLEEQLPVLPQEDQPLNGRGIFLPYARKVELPGLLSVDDIVAPRAISVDISNLDCARDLRFNSVENLKADWLRLAGDITIPKETPFEPYAAQKMVIINSPYCFEEIKYRRGFERPDPYENLKPKKLEA